VTTNFIDHEARKVASDSRWSFVRDGKIHYVDDTSFDKIVITDSVVMICAGNAALIDAWKKWVLQPEFWDVNPPQTDVKDDKGNVVDSITVAIVTRPECQLYYCRGVYWFVDGTFMFTGTGGGHAMACFHSNRDLNRCMESARSDNFTGGTIRIVDVSTGESNLASPQLELENVLTTYSERGCIMDPSNGKITPVRAAANDQAAAPAQAHSLPFSAPTGHDCAPWTPDDHVRLGRALERLKTRALNKQQDK